MDFKNLLGKLTLIEGTMTSAEKNPTGPKFTGQWKGTDAGTPGKKMVGDSILKDLSKGPKAKTLEEELAEAFEQFNEDDLGVEEKRPGRASDRPRRDYGKTGEPSKRYKQVDEHDDPWEVDQDGNPVGWKAQEDEKDRAALAAHAKKYPNGTPNIKPLKAKDAVNIAHKAINQAFGKKDTDESRGHKIVATKLKDIERSGKPLADVDPKAREEQTKAEYRKYVEKMKKINPNYVPMYKMDEAGANNPPQQGMPTLGQQTTGQPDPKQVAATNQALQSIKAGTGSTAPTTNIAKALDAASQGKPVNQTDMKALEPMMKDLTTVAQDPKLASQFKTLAQQVQQVQKKQQTI